MKRISFTLTLLFTLCATAAFAQDELTLNTPLAREIKADETHNYQLKLAAKQFAHLVAEQQGVDIEVNVYDPAGKQILHMDSPNGTQGPEPVWLTNRPAGTYRVEVKPFGGPNQPRGGGKYEIKLAALRAMTAADGKTAQTETLYYEALQLWRQTNNNNNPAGPQDIVAKLKEAVGLLGNDGEASLLAGINQMMFFISPGLRVPELNLVKVPPKAPDAVTVYHSADNGTEAKQQAALFESLLAFFQPRMKTKQQYSMAYLNKTDWAKVSGGQPFFVPFISPEPPMLMLSSDQQMVKGMMGMFKSKVPPDLNEALTRTGMTYESVTPLVIEVGGYINITSYFTTDIFGRLPKAWMNSVVENYLLQVWLGEKQPQLLQRWRLAMRVPGAVMTPATRELDAMFGPGNMPTAGYATSRACDLATQLYDTHKLALIDELSKAFPKGQKVDAATAEARFYKLSPHIKPWAESFGSKTASNNDAAAGAEQDVRVMLEQMRVAILNSDKAFFERVLADNYLETQAEGNTFTKAEYLKTLQPPSRDMKQSIDLADIKIALHGDTAIAMYQFNWHGETKDQKFDTSFRVTDTWQRRNGVWQLLVEQGMHVPQPRKAIKVDAKILDEYTGQYEFGGIVGTYTRDGDKLIEQYADSAIISILQAESETTFFIEGRASTYTFVRDAQNKVTHIVIRMPNQQEFKINKIK